MDKALTDILVEKNFNYQNKEAKFLVRNLLWCRWKKQEYPKGPVKSPMRVPYLLKKYSNLYGDLSAGSGFNAISRDPECGYKFLEEFQDKLLFGTDICHVNQKVSAAFCIKVWLLYLPLT